MAIRYDIKTNNDAFVFVNGDFAIGQSDEQHIQDTIEAFPGWWKQWPDDGVGIRARQGGTANTQQIAKDIRLQLAVDGYKSAPKIGFDQSGNLKIAPNVTI